MLRTGQLPAPLRGGLPPPQRRDLAQRRECCYRGPWRLPGPDSHRLAAVSLSLGYVVVPSFRCSSAPELLAAHSSGITQPAPPRPNQVEGTSNCCMLLRDGRYVDPAHIHCEVIHRPALTRATAEITPSVSRAVSRPRSHVRARPRSPPGGAPCPDFNLQPIHVPKPHHCYSDTPCHPR
jgi:hypothetical protein